MNDSLSVWLDRRADRLGIARHRCEAVDHHADCPGGIDTQGRTRGQFVLHHTIRRTKDKHSPHYDDRDNVDYLRIVWNGTTGLGAGGCHQIIHNNPDNARQHGLIAPRQVHALTLDPTGAYWITQTGTVISAGDSL